MTNPGDQPGTPDRDAVDPHGDAASAGDHDELQGPDAGPGGRQSQLDDLAAEVTRLSDEKARLADQLQRALADMVNVRRQTRRQVDDARDLLVAQILGEFLPIMDNLERAAEHGANAQAQAAGLRLVSDLMRGLLERHGLRRIPAVGTAFDPKIHQAIMTEPRADVPPGTITAEIEAGYKLGDRVIRIAKVRVSEDAAGRKAPGDAQARNDGGDEAGA